MKTCYYIDWFDGALPEKLVKLLHEDLTDRKSFVMLSANCPVEDEEINLTKNTWLGQAGIVFDEYHLINRDVLKSDAQKLVQEASVIFLLGGYTVWQSEFLAEYELPELIRKSDAVVMGASAGSINMSAKWLCSKLNGYEVETSTVYDGIGLNNFSFEAHIELDNTALIYNELFPLSEKIDIYAAEYGSAIRTKNNAVDIIGNVHLISRSKILKLEETI